MDAFDRVDALRADLDAMRPLDPADVARAMQRLRLEWTYHSNAIEGNSLTYGETVALLMHGVTAQGKPLKDHLDIRGHREALDYLDAFVQARESLTLAAIREMHNVLLGEPYESWAETAEGLRVRRTITPGQFKTQPNHVLTQTGEVHHYARPDEVEPRMQALVDAIAATWSEIETGAMHPVRFAAHVHHEVAAVHPFDDGNGRMARLLMNLVLMRARYIPAVIRQERRPAYYGALASADAGDRAPFEQFVADELATTMDLYVRALRGEPDPDAFSRRVALLRREGASQNEQMRARHARWGTEVLSPLLDLTEQRMRQLEPLFTGSERSGVLLAIEGPPIYASSARDFEEIRAALGGGGWRGLQADWTLRRLRAQPALQVDLRWVARASEASLLLRWHVGDAVRERVLTSQTKREADRMVEEAFEMMLNRIESASREAEA